MEVCYLYFPGEITCVVMVPITYINCGQWAHAEAHWHLGKAEEWKLLPSPTALFHRDAPFLPNIQFH